MIRVADNVDPCPRFGSGPDVSSTAPAAKVLVQRQRELTENLADSYKNMVAIRDAEIASLKAEVALLKGRLADANTMLTKAATAILDAPVLLTGPNAPANTANKADEARKAYQRELMRKRRAAAKAKP